MQTKTLAELVKENIDEAIANGYDLTGYTDEELAGDLIAYAIDLQDEDYYEVTKAVKEWRQHNA